MVYLRFAKLISRELPVAAQLQTIGDTLVVAERDETYNRRIGVPFLQPVLSVLVATAAPPNLPTYKVGVAARRAAPSTR